MGQLLVRGLDDKLIEALKLRAHMSGRSVEAEHRAILEEALPVTKEAFLAEAAKLRAHTPRGGTPGHELIRADRDHGWNNDVSDNSG